MTLKDTAGIYKIVNKQNLKCYIGSTKQGFAYRFRDHKRRLKNNKHHSKHLQSAWNKYGSELFEFEVLEVIDKSLDKLYFLQREQYWMDKFQSFDKEFGYNMNPKTELTPIQANPEYYAEHFSNLRNSGGYLVQEPNSEEWLKINNLNKYAKENSLRRSDLGKVLNNRCHTSKGYKIKFFDVNKEASINRKTKVVRFKKPQCIKGYCPVNYYYAENINTKEQTLISNITKFSRENNLHPSTLRQTLTTARYHHKNFKLISLDEHKNNHKQPKWLVMTPEGKELLVDVLKDFCKLHKLQYNSLKQTSDNPKSIQHKGYRCYSLEAVLNNTQNYPKCDFTYKVIDPNDNVYLTNSLIQLGTKLNVNGKYLSHTYRQVKNPLSNWQVNKLINVH